MERRMPGLLIVIAVLLCGIGRAFGAADVPPAPAAAPIRVLILSGENNHDWRHTTPKLREILESSGLCRVDVTEHPEQLTAKSLEPYDVILSNWNTFDRRGHAVRWPEATRQAYLDFVRHGKGHVVVHAGSASFYDWPEYQRLCLATWKIGTTEHGPIHEFPIRIDVTDHPITQGVQPFRTRDELWDHAAVQPGVTVLASAYSGKSRRWEPIAMTGAFGEGRSFTLLLGHNTAGMDNAGFQTLLRRGIAWAAGTHR
jgi:type 1 glutamine amidotransferase